MLTIPISVESRIPYALGWKEIRVTPLSAPGHLRRGLILPLLSLSFFFSGFEGFWGMSTGVLLTLTPSLNTELELL